MTAVLSALKVLQRDAEAPCELGGDPADKWELLDEIHFRRGHSVFKARELGSPHGDVIALTKHQSRQYEGQKNPHAECIRQCILWCDLVHENLIRYYESFYSRDFFWLVSEYAPLGSVAHILQQKILLEASSSTSSQPSSTSSTSHRAVTRLEPVLSEPLVACLAQQALSGLAYLHDHQVVYSHLNCSHLLLFPDGTCKLSGLDITSQHRSRFDALKTNAEPPFWYAPEVLQGGTKTVEADVWSFGITLIEMVHGCPPLSHLPTVQFLAKATSTSEQLSSIAVANQNSSEFLDIVGLACRRRPRDRPAAQTLLKNPWFTKQPASRSEMAEALKSLLSGDGDLSPTTSQCEPQSLTRVLESLLDKELNASSSQTDLLEDYDDTFDTISESLDESDATSSSKKQALLSRAQNNPVKSLGTITRSSIEQVAHEMQDPDSGVHVKDRYFHLRKYKKCFVGHEAVEWLVKRYTLESKAEAVELGKAMMSRGLIAHVCASEPFEDRYYFYRFTDALLKPKKTVHPSQAARAKKNRKHPVNITSKELLQFTEVELNKLKALMLDDRTGLDIRDRRWRLKKYPRCFVGHEAVAWMKQRLNLTADEDALQLGQLMIDRGIFHHVANDQPFRNDYKFYRFYCHEAGYVETTGDVKRITKRIQKVSQSERPSRPSGVQQSASLDFFEDDLSLDGLSSLDINSM
eukprot:CAMPEP_0174240582 /NCGR_PEP_ID=MMETSP0417-20130205/19402_1 /TAXON_ID=242541 /ORGANISM="Mayorella sp, Strain BSH-02190019" /LENGTH=691 /DNA_ID=CAMNT_0015319697 /DNA_START=50 /DNA_END=2122 /DNA_ORIENTATION=-